MAKVTGTGLFPIFTTQGIQEYVDSKTEEYKEKAILTAQYLGEQFVNLARSNRTYMDRTGNLRSSIGYIIIYDGRLIDRNFQAGPRGTDRNTGVREAQSFAEELAGRYPTGLILIGVAGMEYAAAVEAKGYDVITGAAPTSQEFKDIFNEIEF